VLAERVAAWTGPDPDLLDLLRCAPERRDAARALLPPPDREWRAAVHYALGGPTPELPDLDPGLWYCASRERSPWIVDPWATDTLPSGGPDCPRPASYTWALSTGEVGWFAQHVQLPDHPRERPLPHCVLQVLHHHRMSHGTTSSGGLPGTRWLRTLWPVGQEALFAAACDQFARNADWWEAAWQNKTLLEPLLDPDTPLRSMGALLIGLGLCAKEPGEHLLAVDVAITTIADGRLGSDNLGATLAGLFAWSNAKLGRPAKTLAQVAAVSPAHAAVVATALAPLMPGLLADRPRDLVKLLALHEQLCAQLDLPVTDDLATALAAVQGNSKLATTAKRLATRTGDGRAMQAAVAELTALRIEAAAVWA
jgi:hypothetical protein